VRDDGWVESGSEVPIYYDSLLSKVIVWGQDRTQATARMRRALGEYEIRGVRSTLPFSRWLLARPEFIEARFHTRYLDGLLQQRSGEPFGGPDPSLEEVAAIAACLVEASSDGRGSADRPVVTDAPAGRYVVAGAGRPMARSWKARARQESLRA
jgi:acetyl/propionyl-CoA carboxylase alpha subunit